MRRKVPMSSIIRQKVGIRFIFMSRFLFGMLMANPETSVSLSEKSIPKPEILYISLSIWPVWLKKELLLRYLQQA